MGACEICGQPGYIEVVLESGTYWFCGMEHYDEWRENVQGQLGEG